MSDAQDAPTGVNINHGGKKKFSMSLGTTLSAASLAISVALGGYLAYDKFVIQPQNISTISTYIQNVSTSLTKKFGSQKEISDSEVNAIQTKIVTSIEDNIDQAITRKLDEAKSQTINDIQVWFQQNPPQIEMPEQPALDPNMVVNTVLNRLRQSGELNNDAHLVDDYARKRLEDIQGQLNNLSKQVSNVQVAGVASGIVKEPTRLKEFNIIAPPLKDNTVFVIDAPKKNGKSNTITLTMGETFYSKHGAHKVIGIEDGPNGASRLRVTGHFYIDGKREEFTPAELAALKKSEKPKKSSTTPPSTRIKSKAEPVSQVASNMVELKNWTVITTKPKEKEVLVYNPNTNSPLSLKQNTYVAGIGTVRNINLQTGETQFERYYIRGNQ
ncbi:hypothetical protein [Vibrio sp. TRT 29B02]|uniref:hypothetical protein n=1 Tax=Vibrio sp. TRT 29B02 TaxID=3418508 RepID=UPI003CF58DC2